MKKYYSITLASFIYSVAVAVYLQPHGLAAGGVSGLAILITGIISINTGIIIFLINFPLLILGGMKLGRNFAVKTIYATVISSVMIATLEWLQPPFIVQDTFLSSIVGGILQAAGLGIVFRNGATTGGTDVIVSLITSKYKRLRTGIVFLLIDSSIITASWLITGDREKSVCAAVTLITCSMLMDVFILGNSKKQK